MDSMELGGNIVLTGFSGCDSGTMIILKKIIGNYARDFSEQLDDFERLHVKLSPSERNFNVEAVITRKGIPSTSASSESNIFISVDNALKTIRKNS